MLFLSKPQNLQDAMFMPELHRYFWIKKRKLFIPTGWEEGWGFGGGVCCACPLYNNSPPYKGYSTQRCAGTASPFSRGTFASPHPLDKSLLSSLQVPNIYKARKRKTCCVRKRNEPKIRSVQNKKRRKPLGAQQKKLEPGLKTKKIHDNFWARFFSTVF